MSTYVEPAEVEQLADDLAHAIDALPETLEAAELAGDLDAWLGMPLDWLTAPDRWREGLGLEARLATLQGPKGAAFNTGPHASGADAPATHTLVTPGDVLAYRKTWDDFVVGTARAATTAAAAVDQEAANAATADARAQAMRKRDELTADATAIMLLWNDYANTPDDQIVLGAASILQDFQKTVLKVAQIYQPQIAKLWPAVSLPSPPTLDAQSQVIGRIEGLGILAHGILQLIGEAAGGAVEELGAVGHTIAETASVLAGPGPWIAAGVVLAGLLVLGGRR